MGFEVSAEGVPFQIALARPVDVVVPGQLHPSGRTTSVPARKLAEDALRDAPMCLTFEGRTL